jgi:hypothetical protein
MNEPAHAIDKSKWTKGEWTDELDHIAFEHKGVPCIIHRSPSSGALCGYAAVPPGHPWHGKRYQDIDADVNGGLSYGEACQGAICHVPKPGEPDDVYWLGFDCAHGHDISPAHSQFGDHFMGGEHFSTYKDVAFVRRDCERLAEQIIEAAK